MYQVLLVLRLVVAQLVLMRLHLLHLEQIYWYQEAFVLDLVKTLDNSFVLLLLLVMV